MPHTSSQALTARLLTPLLLATALLAGPATAEPQRYVLDPTHLSVGFLVDHLGYAKTLGMFREVEGEFQFDEDTGVMTDLEVRIDTASVFTNHDGRDEHLRGGDFLDVKRHPQMIYRAARAEPTADRRYRIEGELELLGERRPVVLEATWNKSGGYPFVIALFEGMPKVIGISARGSFQRSDFGMDYVVDKGWVGDEVELIIEFEARGQ